MTLIDGRATHLIDVLRAQAGQDVRIGIVDGALGVGTVSSIAGRTVTLVCALEGTPPPRPVVDLLLAVPRPKVLRRLWPQLAALGVGRVMLTNAARVERPYFATHFLEAAIYRPLLLEGLQQARDTHVPVVSIHRQFRPLVEDQLDAFGPYAGRLVAHPGVTARIADRATGVGDGRVLLAIGPEGGWNAFELELLAAHGFETVAIGTRTLRSDTAVIAALTLLHDAIGQ